MRLKYLLTSTALSLATMQTAALAQDYPPERYVLDPRGVDLVSGQWTPVTTSISIGPTDTGLAYTRIGIPAGSSGFDAASGGANCMVTECVVVADGVTEWFDMTSTGVITPRENTGSTLVYNSATGVYVYTRSGGTRWTGSHKNVQTSSTPNSWTSRTEPNGLTVTYSYREQPACTQEPPDPCLPVLAARLQSYQTNTGYQIHYEYHSDADPNDESWISIKAVTAINLAIDYCDPLATSCTGLTRTWPRLEFETTTAGLVSETTVTDQAGTETRYRSDGTPQLQVFVGADSTPLITVKPSVGVPVTEVTDATGTWTYSQTVVGAEQTITADGPLGQRTSVVTDLTVGRPSSMTQRTSVSPAANRTWSWTYDAGLRVATATGPEGESSSYTYDGRGNVTSTTMSPKPGSSEADLVVSAIYPSACTNPITCNSPTSTMDPAGNITDYVWDSAHGGLLSVTSPAPSAGAARPQTRIDYAAQTAQFKDGSGLVVPAASAVTLPVRTTACAVGSSCGGTDAEVLATINYGVVAGVANNLQPASISRGSGVAPAMAVRAMTFTPDGDIATVDGPLPGSSDTWAYRYDTSRRMVGAIGPDPDGSGPRLNRAQRTIYNDRGQVTLTETGTTIGYGDPAWAAFAPLLKVDVAYDALGRPVQSRQLSATGAIAGIQQISYDAAGRVSCTATRMNPLTFSALPVSACTAAPAGAYGADRIRQMTYDAAGRPLSVSSALGTADAETSSQTYAVNGQIASLTDGRGNVSVFEYDGFNRPSRLRYPNTSGGGASTTDYQQTNYDAWGRVFSVRNRAGAITYLGYDRLNRLIAVNAPGSTPDISSAYDNLGRMTVTGNGTITVVTTWDALSRPVLEGSSVIGGMTYEYDEAGRLTKMKWPDSFAANYSRDVYGAITAISQQPGGVGATQVAAYSWNDLGQPTGVNRAGGAGAATAYSYDAWGRLTGMSHDASGSANDVAFGYSYNPAGQIVGRMVSNGLYVHGAAPTGTTAYQVDGQNQLDTIDSTAVTHDSGGNVTGVLGRTYGYDDLNRLTSTGAGAATFAFDPMDRLATSTVGGASIRRQYTGYQLVAEYNPATGGLTKRYVPGLGLDDVVVAYDGPGTSTRNWQLADERGSVIAFSGATGAVSNINTYDEYGVPASGNIGRFQYTGQQWLPEAGAYHYRARAYLPEVGRFLQPDPMGYLSGTNLYSYVAADPVNFSDPSGLARQQMGLDCSTVSVPGQKDPPIKPITSCKPAWIESPVSLIFGSATRGGNSDLMGPVDDLIGFIGGLGRPDPSRRHSLSRGCDHLERQTRRPEIRDAIRATAERGEISGREEGFWASIDANGTVFIQPVAASDHLADDIDPGPRPVGRFVFQAFYHYHTRQGLPSFADTQWARGVPGRAGINFVTILAEGSFFQCP